MNQYDYRQSLLFATDYDTYGDILICYDVM